MTAVDRSRPPEPAAVPLFRLPDVHLSAGADGFVKKPFDVAKLVERIEELLHV